MTRLLENKIKTERARELLNQYVCLIKSQSQLAGAGMNRECIAAVDAKRALVHTELLIELGCKTVNTRDQCKECDGMRNCAKFLLAVFCEEVLTEKEAA